MWTLVWTHSCAQKLMTTSIIQNDSRQFVNYPQQTNIMFVMKYTFGRLVASVLRTNIKKVHKYGKNNRRVVFKRSLQQIFDGFDFFLSFSCQMDTASNISLVFCTTSLIFRLCFYSVQAALKSTVDLRLLDIFLIILSSHHAFSESFRYCSDENVCLSKFPNLATPRFDNKNFGEIFNFSEYKDTI